MRTWKVRRTRDGRHEVLFLYGKHWVKVGWFWEHADAERFAKEGA